MTTCVAAICDDGNAIIITADKLVGAGFIESPIGKKILQLHPNWKIMIAGNDIGPAYPIIDRAQKKLEPITAPTINQVADAVQQAYNEEQAKEAEQIFLTARGFTMAKFVNEGKQLLTEADFIRIGSEIEGAQFQLSLLVTGFDDHGAAHIFVLYGGTNKGFIRIYKEFCAIGSGETNATFLMNFRELKPDMPIRRTLYYVLEAKYYGELAPSVGLDTDLYVLRFGKDDIKINDASVDQKLVKIAVQNEPRKLTLGQILSINQLPELDGIPLLKGPQPRPQRQNRDPGDPNDPHRPDHGK
jgi:20S proteasome alpha/beta subunit